MGCVWKHEMDDPKSTRSSPIFDRLKVFLSFRFSFLKATMMYNKWKIGVHVDLSFHSSKKKYKKNMKKTEKSILHTNRTKTRIAVALDPHSLVHQT